MKLQQNRANPSPAHRDDVETGDRRHRRPARQTVIDACPEDCHYCWGPETD